MTARINEFNPDPAARFKKNFEVSEKMFSTMENPLKQIAESDPAAHSAIAVRNTAEQALLRVHYLSKQLDLMIVPKTEVANV